MSNQPPDAGLSAQLGRIADGLARLMSQHFALARLELADDARRMGRGVAGIALFIPFILLGYGFLCAAVVALLVDRLGLPGALALVGGGNALLGTLGLWVGVRVLKGRAVMDDTVDELRRSAELLPGSHQEGR